MIITGTPGTVFDKIALDNFGSLPKTRDNNEYILTMHDQLSKFCVVVPLPNATSASITDAFIKRCICFF